MKNRLLFLLAAFSLPANPQTWSTFLDPSRAIDWTGVGFTIPNYTANCSTQPSLTANDPSAAAANTTAIQKALASCNATHNVVNIPAGTYYVAGWTYGSQGKQVVRGAGPMSTTVYPTTTVGCLGLWTGICMISSPAQYSNGAVVLPPNGTQQCAWTGGYSQGTTTITLSSCPGGGPPVNKTLFLDQANDFTDTGGQYICDTSTDNGTNCTNKGPGGGNQDGRIINGVTHSQKQAVYVTGVTANKDGSYSVTISPGVYFNNIRSGQSPGAWWAGFVQNDGLENLTVDHSQSTANTAITMFNCSQCWVKNVRSLYATRDHVLIEQSLNSVIRDSYFYQAQGHLSQSYAVEFELSSRILVENNIFQQVTNPIMFGQGSGSVIGYNYSVDNEYGTGVWPQASYYAHNAGSEMNLWEGNNFFGIWSDSTTWGSSTTGTLFRNMMIGWQSGKSQSTYPVSLNSWSRVFNVVGNVMGQPGYDTNYESYATSSSGGVNGGATVNTSIYALGWTGMNGVGGCSGPPVCDPLVRPTLMRWGNYDTVTGGTKWDSTEAAPAAVPYVNANFTSSYFSSLAQTLPASLYYSSKPTWWPAAKAWPPVGPDVSSGNLGVCGGTYAGAQATASGQCTGGSWSSAWAAHANSIPAQDCYLNVMKGPPDGTGNVLNFDASLCYASYQPRPASPTGLTTTVH